jgi:hypothetical protein
MEAPRRLSELLQAACELDEPEVIELVWLGALWAFAPDAPEDSEVEMPIRLRELTEGVTAMDDGVALDRPDFLGADLLVGAPHILLALQHEPCTTSMYDPRPISLEAFRSGR